MLAKYDNNGSSFDRKLSQEAQLMLEDARRKIEYIRMQQLRLRNLKSGSADSDGNTLTVLLIMKSGLADNDGGTLTGTSHNEVWLSR